MTYDTLETSIVVQAHRVALQLLKEGSEHTVIRVPGCKVVYVCRKLQYPPYHVLGTFVLKNVTMYLCIVRQIDTD